MRFDFSDIRALKSFCFSSDAKYFSVMLRAAKIAALYGEMFFDLLDISLRLEFKKSAIFCTRSAGASVLIVNVWSKMRTETSFFAPIN